MTEVSIEWSNLHVGYTSSAAKLVSQLTTQKKFWPFGLVVVLCVFGGYWVISCFWGSCTVISMLGVCFWVLVCWFPVQNRVQPIVQRMRINGSRRRMNLRLRIRGSNL